MSVLAAERRPVLVEACVASTQQAVAAEAAGADRLELCGPGDGGTTPSLGLLEQCLASVRIPVHAMIRPHADGFEMHPAWHAVMQRDIALSLGAGAAGVVLGALKHDEIDVTCVQACVEAADGAPVVFHRAFDRIADQERALDTLMALGVRGVLTAGGPARAVDGAAMLARLQQRAGPRLNVVAGGGVRADTVGPLLDRAALREVHVRATDRSVFADAVRAVRAWSGRVISATCMIAALSASAPDALRAQPTPRLQETLAAQRTLRATSSHTATIAQDDARYSIIPRPQLLEPRAGSFTITASTRIIVSASDSMLGHTLSRTLAPSTGFALRVIVGESSATESNAILLTRDVALDSLGAEGYTLEISTSGASVRAAGAAGLFYGIQSLRQLLPPESFRDAPTPGAAWTTPAVHIVDKPRFAWRGAHLDVARHFMPVSFVKRWLDLMALHKLNTFHWHLTEDQGWRIEILQYPKLTSVGGCRDQTLLGAFVTDPAKRVFDGIRHCGFYTQDDVREVVAYAAARHITVVPEIEMPGHAQAAIAAYPELGVYPDSSVSVMQVWGVSDVILNVEPSTITFMQNVLGEVLELFPGLYVHIGGDEAAKTQWKASARVQERMRELGLRDEHELQSWFIRQMDSYLTARGRRLVGWDEILEGGLAPNATVMSWRGVAGGIAAARAGHDVVMAPTSHTYLDYYQSRDLANEPRAFGGFLPLDTVYAFEPVPDALNAEEAKHILGAQGQHWSEYMKTPRNVEYMAYPRLSALAEVVWTERERKDHAHFRARLNAHMQRLRAMSVNARPLDVVP